MCNYTVYIKERENRIRYWRTETKTKGEAHGEKGKEREKEKKENETGLTRRTELYLQTGTPETLTRRQGRWRRMTRRRGENREWRDWDRQTSRTTAQKQHPLQKKIERGVTSHRLLMSFGCCVLFRPRSFLLSPVGGVSGRRRNETREEWEGKGSTVRAPEGVDFCLYAI